MDGPQKGYKKLITFLIEAKNCLSFETDVEGCFFKSLFLSFAAIQYGINYSVLAYDK